METENEEDDPKPNEGKKPKPIMAVGIFNISEFIKILPKSGEFEFESTLSGSY